MKRSCINDIDFANTQSPLNGSLLSSFNTLEPMPAGPLVCDFSKLSVVPGFVVDLVLFFSAVFFVPLDAVFLVVIPIFSLDSSCKGPIHGEPSGTVCVHLLSPVMSCIARYCALELEYALYSFRAMFSRSSKAGKSLAASNR